MRLIILTTLFVIPLIGFASFPVKTTITSDTIIETKKETIEENNIKFQNSKKNDKDFFTELLFIISGIIFFIIGNLNFQTSRSFYDIFLMIIGGISFVLGFLIFLIKLITRSIKRMRNKEKKLKSEE
jgi:hypothetical protein